VAPANRSRSAAPSFADWDVGAYASYRPRYPESLIDTVSARCSRHEAAWDCAAGSGAASTALATRFRRVVASGINREQIGAAPADQYFARLACDGMAAPFRDRSFDLVVVAQALHWFAVPEFFAEVSRVAAGGGVLAAWTYELFRVSPAVDAVIHDYYSNVVGSHWPAERRHIEEEYASINFPFATRETRRAEMSRTWTARQTLAYLGTWSATGRYRDAHGTDPLLALSEALTTAWGTESRPVVWPITLQLCDVP